MSLGGVTIDYGPYGFIDYFSKDFLGNQADEHERYAFRRQPAIVEGNLERLAESMDPLYPHSMAMNYLKANYQTFYQNKYYSLMSAKLGLEQFESAIELINDLLDTMH